AAKQVAAGTVRRGQTAGECPGRASADVNERRTIPGVTGGSADDDLVALDRERTAEATAAADRLLGNPVAAGEAVHIDLIRAGVADEGGVSSDGHRGAEIGAAGSAQLFQLQPVCAEALEEIGRTDAAIGVGRANDDGVAADADAGAKLIVQLD